MRRKVIFILVVELLVAAAFALSMNDFRIDYDFFTLLGLCNLIIGVIGGFVGLVAVIARIDKDNSILAAAGILLLLGTLTCSIFPF